MTDRRGTLATDVDGRLVRRSIVLEVVAGPDRGLVKKLDAGAVLLGAHRDCDIVLTDPRVSRRHCEVSLVDDGVRVRDLDSTNGVKIADAKVGAAVVAAGSTIVLGDTSIRLVAKDAIVPATADATGNAKLGDLTTKSAPMAHVLQILARVAKTDATILLEGEGGVGKDHIARTVHATSRRRTAPFVVVACGSQSPALLPSQLFGHKKGAFAGAADDRAGAFEQASGGTLFIDDVGALPLDLQPTLLRAIETATVTRVGETHARAVDVRVVVAATGPLRARVKDALFREDLYQRLAVIRVVVPALRERRDDIPALVKQFLVENGKPAGAMSPKDLQALAQRDWPGNARELKGFIERACALGDVAGGGAKDGRIDLSMLPLDPSFGGPEIGADDDDMEAPTVPSSPPPFSTVGGRAQGKGGARRSSRATSDGRARTDLDSATEPEVGMPAAIRAAIAHGSAKPSFASRSKSLASRAGSALDDDDNDGAGVVQEDPTDRASKRHKAATNAQVAGAAVDVDVGVPLKDAKEALVGEFERAYLVKLLDKHKGNVAQAAKAAGIDRAHLERLIKRHAIDAARPKG